MAPGASCCVAWAPNTRCSTRTEFGKREVGAGIEIAAGRSRASKFVECPCAPAAATNARSLPVGIGRLGGRQAAIGHQFGQGALSGALLFGGNVHVLPAAETVGDGGRGPPVDVAQGLVPPRAVPRARDDRPATSRLRRSLAILLFTETRTSCAIDWPSLGETACKDREVFQLEQHFMRRDAAPGPPTPSGWAFPRSRRAGSPAKIPSRSRHSMCRMCGRLSFIFTPAMGKPKSCQKVAGLLAMLHRHTRAVSLIAPGPGRQGNSDEQDSIHQGCCARAASEAFHR